MTTTSFLRRRSAMMAVVPILVVFAAGCQERPAAPAARVYAADLTGRARACTVPSVTLADARPNEATMAIGNDGGWCGISVAQPNRRPYSAGLVQTRAQHGQVHVHTVGDQTRIDYTPDANFSGSDAFSVRLVPGNAVLNVTVTVAQRT